MRPSFAHIPLQNHTYYLKEVMRYAVYLGENRPIAGI